jgi:hypothetical protein
LQQEKFDLKLVSFDEAELERLLAEQDLGAELMDADALPPMPVVPITAPGDLWIRCHQHRSE